MKNIITHIFFFILITTSISCESLIEIDLPTDQTNTENIFKTEETITSALSSLYSDIRETSPFTGGASGLSTTLGLYTDELESLSTSVTSSNYLLYTNNIAENTAIIATLWNNSYSNIYSINSFIEGLEKSEALPDNKKNIFLAEAYLLRALYYQTLIQLFGSIPYTTSTDHKTNTVLKKTDYMDCLLLIEKDLLIANEGLTYTSRSINKFYPTKIVAEILLSTNYLLQKKYEQAELYASKAVNNPEYKLETELNLVFKNNSRSTIWQISNSNSTAATWEARTFIIRTSSPQFCLSSSLYNSFSNSDLRKEAWTNVYPLKNLPYSNKYKNALSPNTDEFSIMFRIEEAYFLLIESLIYQEKEKQAIPILNQLRQKAGITKALPNSLTKEQVIQEMLDESRKEFFLERGKRFFDLKRNNKLNTLKNTKPNWQDDHSLFPYPERETSLNPNLNSINE
ncbi:RagB/SusD family nutrient uptake outer membrane protein [Myroides sp. LJL119]